MPFSYTNLCPVENIFFLSSIIPFKADRIDLTKQEKNAKTKMNQRSYTVQGTKESLDTFNSFLKYSLSHTCVRALFDGEQYTPMVLVYETNRPSMTFLNMLFVSMTFERERKKEKKEEGERENIIPLTYFVVVLG